MGNLNAIWIAFQFLSCIASHSRRNEDVLNGKLEAKLTDDTEISCVWTSAVDCEITCSSAPVTDITSIIEHLLIHQSHSKPCDGIALVLKLCIFPRNTITREWFSSNIAIDKLTIEDNASIADIDPDSFDIAAFRQMAQLQITNPNINTIRRHTFKGLSKLTTLALFKWPLTHIEPKILEHTPWLQTLQIEESRAPLNVNNITGTTGAATLQIVSLRYNNLCRTISNDTFWGLASVLSLYMSNSQIRSIAVNAFYPISATIQQIYLNGNYLKTLSASLFERLAPNGNWRIYLDENPWSCDCNLFELKQSIERQPKNFVNSLICHSPVVNSKKDIIDVSITPCDNDDTILETCQKHSDDNSVNIFRESPIKFRQLNDQIVEVDVDFRSSDYELLWFNPNESCKMLDILDGQNVCAREFQSIVNISNLSPDNAYMFCAVPKFSNAISPFDCAPFYVKSMRPQLSQEDRSKEDSYFVIVVVFVSLLLCALLFGIVFGVCLAKRYPTFIKSTSSRVVIQQLNHNEIWRKTERPAATRNNQTIRTLYRSVSEASVASSRSYVTAVAPSPFEMISWRKEHKSSVCQRAVKNEICLDTFMLDRPPTPPLPKRMHAPHRTRDSGREKVRKY